MSFKKSLKTQHRYFYVPQILSGKSYVLEDVLIRAREQKAGATAWYHMSVLESYGVVGFYKKWTLQVQFLLPRAAN